MENTTGRIDLDVPIWDQNTFVGRLKYYAWVTDPRLSFCSQVQLTEAKTLLHKYRYGICYIQLVTHVTKKGLLDISLYYCPVSYERA